MIFKNYLKLKGRGVAPTPLRNIGLIAYIRVEERE
jgi:hypothetical protein